MAEEKDGNSAKTAGSQKNSDTSAATNAILIDVGPAILVVSYLRAKLEEARETAENTETIDRMLDVATTFINVFDCQSKTMTRVF